MPRRNAAANDLDLPVFIAPIHLCAKFLVLVEEAARATFAQAPCRFPDVHAVNGQLRSARFVRIQIPSRNVRIDALVRRVAPGVECLAVEVGKKPVEHVFGNLVCVAFLCASAKRPQNAANRVHDPCPQVSFLERVADALVRQLRYELMHVLRSVFKEIILGKVVFYGVVYLVQVFHRVAKLLADNNVLRLSPLAVNKAYRVVRGGVYHFVKHRVGLELRSIRRVHVGKVKFDVSAKFNAKHPRPRFAPFPLSLPRVFLQVSDCKPDVGVLHDVKHLVHQFAGFLVRVERVEQVVGILHGNLPLADLDSLRLWRVAEPPAVFDGLDVVNAVGLDALFSVSAKFAVFARRDTRLRLPVRDDRLDVACHLVVPVRLCERKAFPQLRVASVGEKAKPLRGCEGDLRIDLRRNLRRIGRLRLGFRGGFRILFRRGRRRSGRGWLGLDGVSVLIQLDSIALVEIQERPVRPFYLGGGVASLCADHLGGGELRVRLARVVGGLFECRALRGRVRHVGATGLLRGFGSYGLVEEVAALLSAEVEKGLPHLALASLERGVKAPLNLRPVADAPLLRRYFFGGSAVEGEVSSFGVGSSPRASISRALRIARDIFRSPSFVFASIAFSFQFPNPVGHHRVFYQTFGLLGVGKERIAPHSLRHERQHVAVAVVVHDLPRLVRVVEAQRVTRLERTQSVTAERIESFTLPVVTVNLRKGVVVLLVGGGLGLQLVDVVLLAADFRSVGAVGLLRLAPMPLLGRLHALAGQLAALALRPLRVVVAVVKNRLVELFGRHVGDGGVVKLVGKPLEHPVILPGLE